MGKVSHLFIVEKFKGHHPYVDIVDKEQCEGVPHMEKFFQDVVNKGGEGIILRDPKAPYQPGRAPGYLKHKVGEDIPSNE